MTLYCSIGTKQTQNEKVSNIEHNLYIRGFKESWRPDSAVKQLLYMIQCGWKRIVQVLEYVHKFKL